MATVKDRVSGNGCPFCSGKRVLKGFNDLATTNPVLAKEWDFVKNEKTPSEVTAGVSYKAFWKCKTCGYSWQAAVYSRSSGNGCPKCASARKGRKKDKGNDLPGSGP